MDGLFVTLTFGMLALTWGLLRLCEAVGGAS